ncbi:MAG: Spy0128 family protein [Eubacterium sp.]|jgi:pilin isopeptide linkage protein
MNIRLLFSRPKKAVIIGLAALFVVLFLTPFYAHASSYRQGIIVSSYDISITTSWTADTDPMPVDVTMSYSGIFRLYNEYAEAGSSFAESFPESIQINYYGEKCGEAVKSSVSNEAYKIQVYTYSVDIPFHFSSYDAETKSETKRFFTDSLIHDAFSYSFGDVELAYNNRYRCDGYYFIISDAFDMEKIKNSQISEVSTNGVQYDYTVERSNSEVEETAGTGDSSYTKRTYFINFAVTNNTKLDGSLELEALKTVNNGTPDQSYSFCLLDSDGNILQTKQNDTDGSIQFDPIKYSASDVGVEFTYQVAEQAGTDENTTYDDSVYTVKVTPYQDSEDHSKIIAVPTITKDGEEVSSITFNNTVEKKGKIAAKVADNTDNAAPPEDNTGSAAPNTGDGAEPAIWAAAAAAACGIGLKLRGKAKENGE